MNAERSSRPESSGFEAGLQLRPRVVVLDEGGTSQVEILKLPPSTTLGTSFSHCGKAWRVTALRTGKRVLIAEPVQN